MRKTKPAPKRTGKSKRSAPATTARKKKKKTSRRPSAAPARTRRKKKTSRGPSAAPARARRKKKTSHGPPSAPANLGIEQAWRYVDRFSRALWNKRMRGEQPGSLAEIITILRDEQVLPAHEASMMHNIRSLRNMLVHENVRFGADEDTIARAAWQIIRRWADRREGEVWRLTLNVCGKRAA